MNEMKAQAKRLTDIAKELEQIDVTLMYAIHTKNERLYYGMIGSMIHACIVLLRNISFYLLREL